MPRRMLSLLSLLIAILVASTALFALLTRGSGSNAGWEQVQVPQGAVQEGQPFQISRFAYQRSSFAIGEIQLSIRNITQSRQEGVVWVLLAPPDSEEAWREAVWVSDEQSITLDGGGTTDLTFAPPAEILQGTFALSAWVHGIRAGERFHADGAGSPALIYLGAPFNIAIVEIAHEEQIDGSIGLDVTIEASNHSGTAIPASLLFTLVSSPNGRASETEGLPIYISPSYETTLDHGETAAATLHGSAQLPAGTYAVVALLRKSEDNSEVSRVVASEILNIE
ncbi:MAG: hypothetical protein JNL42_13145 [Anaerolineae bacterium]|nr:hypothetical protein [Anaerolineae bacterium]